MVKDIYANMGLVFIAVESLGILIQEEETVWAVQNNWFIIVARIYTIKGGREEVGPEWRAKLSEKSD